MSHLFEYVPEDTNHIPSFKLYLSGYIEGCFSPLTDIVLPMRDYSPLFYQAMSKYVLSHPEKHFCFTYTQPRNEWNDFFAQLGSQTIHYRGTVSCVCSSQEILEKFLKNLPEDSKEDAPQAVSQIVQA